MPRYLPPNLTADCQCRDEPRRSMFCMTGHMLECHFPMNCGTAGCSHLSGYEYDTEAIKAFLARAEAMLKSRAKPECPNCQGAGMKTINTTFSEMFNTTPDKIPGDWPGRMGMGDEIEVLGPCDCLEPYNEWLDRLQDEMETKE